MDSGDSQYPQVHQRAISKPLNCEMVTGNATMVNGVQKALENMENMNTVFGPKIMGLDSRD